MKRTCPILAWVLLGALLAQADVLPGHCPRAAAPAGVRDYLNPLMGRFWTMDSHEGNASDPLSLHKYLYAQANPLNMTDPSGHESLVNVSATMTLMNLIVMHEARGANAALKGDQALFGGDDVTVGITYGLDVLEAIDNAVAVTSLAAGVAYGGYKLITFVSNGTQRLIKNIRRIRAEVANARWPSQPGRYGPPYRSESFPREFTTASELEFVRVHGPNNAGREGSWVVRVEEIAGKSSQEIREWLALEHMPTHISTVRVPPNKVMRVGYAAEQPNFGVKGGGVQYEILDPEGVQYFNTRPLR